MKIKAKIHTIAFWVCLCTSIGLIVGGFFVPPLGVIDGSVITAVGELLGFATIAMIPTLGNKTTKVTTRSGTSIEMQAKDGKEVKNNEGD